MFGFPSIEIKIKMNIPVYKMLLLLVLNLLLVQSYEILFQEYCIEGSAPDALPSAGKKSSGRIKMSKSPENGTWYKPNLNCSVTISVEKDYLLFLTFSNVSLRNSSMDNLTVLYNSDKSAVPLSGQQVCSNENCEGLKFDSGEFNNLTLIFLSSNATVPSNVTGFHAHYTVYDLVGANGACRNRKQFLCENGHCIWYQLVCDGHNDCGDRSDETKCIIPVPDTVWGIVVIVVAILSIIIFVPLFCCLATVGTRSIVKSVTVSNPATPLIAATDCGEVSGLLTSSDVLSNCWPGTSYERRNSFSNGTSVEEGTSEPRKKHRSLSEACEQQGGGKL